MWRLLAGIIYIARMEVRVYDRQREERGQSTESEYPRDTEAHYVTALYLNACLSMYC